MSVYMRCFMFYSHVLELSARYLRIRSQAIWSMTLSTSIMTTIQEQFGTANLFRINNLQCYPVLSGL